MLAKQLTYTERANYCQSPLANQLLKLMDDKKSNLALSADVTSAQELIALASSLGPEICMLKTHIDIIHDFSPALTQQLLRLAEEHHFLIFEDRKFADIGNTVKHQYSGGIYRIADWAHMINAHILPGPGIVDGLADVGRKRNRGLILLAEMSSAGNFMDDEYAKNTLKIAQQYPDFVIGFITQHTLSDDPQWINMTPGVQLEKGQDTLGQQYITPEIAINESGNDLIIVGRGIIAAENPLAMARKYREAAWRCYERRVIPI